DAEFTGDGDLLAVGVAGQELLVGNRQRRDRVDLDARRDLLRDRLRIGLDTGHQNGGAKDRGRDGKAPVCEHWSPPVFSCWMKQLEQLVNGLSNPVWIAAQGVSKFAGRRL